MSTTKPRRKPIGSERSDGIEAIAESHELSALGDLASEFASEIWRSPFTRPSGEPAGERIPLVSIAALLGQFVHDGGWYPSPLLTDEKLRQPPDVSVRISGGLLSGTVDTRLQPRIEQQHRTALAKGFLTARDAHPAFVRLCGMSGFREVIETFETARDRSKPASPLRLPQAEAQLIICISRSLPRLQVKGWRPAPTRKTMRAVKKAAKVLIDAAKDGMHSVSGYWRVLGDMRELLRQPDVQPGRVRAPKLDKDTARNAALAFFEEYLAIYFPAECITKDLSGVRRAYAALLGFQNPSDKMSP